MLCVFCVTAPSRDAFLDAAWLSVGQSFPVAHEKGVHANDIIMSISEPPSTFEGGLGGAAPARARAVDFFDVLQPQGCLQIKGQAYEEKTKKKKRKNGMKSKKRRREVGNSSGRMSGSEYSSSSSDSSGVAAASRRERKKTKAAEVTAGSVASVDKGVQKKHSGGGALFKLGLPDDFLIDTLGDKQNLEFDSLYRLDVAKYQVCTSGRLLLFF
jgi:hypothetical protein